jgi:hypothetical protein
LTISWKVTAIISRINNTKPAKCTYPS